MARFSVGEAATAGFGVIGRKPLAVVGWAIALIVAFGLPAILLFVGLGPQLHQLIQLAMAQKGGEPSPEMMQRMLQAQSGMSAMNLLWWLWSTFVRAMFCAAVFRAVLNPEQSAWAYLRVGSREMWLTLLLLVEQVLAMIVVFVVALIVGVLTAVVAVAGGAHNPGPAIATACVAALAAFGVLTWVALHLSMAAPMTFADNQFRLFESWDLTKGHIWRLLGVLLLSVLFVLVMEVVFGGLILGLVFAAGGSLAAMHGAGGIEAFLARPPLEILQLVWPWLAVFVVLGALFGAVVQAVFCAPWALIHRALTARA